jgi:hypothetical protein
MSGGGGEPSALNASSLSFKHDQPFHQSCRCGLSGSNCIRRGIPQHVMFFPPCWWLTTSTAPSLSVSGSSEGYPKGKQAPPPLESELGTFLTCNKYVPFLLLRGISYIMGLPNT